MLNTTYSEVVHWRPNYFKVPQGNVGTSFVCEIARLFKAFASGSALESVALKAATVLPILLLQKPSRNSKAKLHTICLKRRLKNWLDGDLDQLIFEGRTIQNRLPKQYAPPLAAERLANRFAKLMFQGKVKAALDLLSDKVNAGTLGLDDLIPKSDGEHQSVREILKAKHPPGEPAIWDSLIDVDPPPVHSVIFDSLDASTIRAAAMRTKGAAGPSGIDAYG